MLEGKNLPKYLDKDGNEINAVQCKKITQRAEDGLFVIEPYGSTTGPVYAEATGTLDEQPEKGDYCVQLFEGQVIFMKAEEFEKQFKKA